MSVRASARRRKRRRIITRLVARDGGYCWMCKRPLVGGDGMTIDHVIPRSRGGTNWIGNLRLACGPCNRHRGAPDHPVVDPRQVTW